MTSGATDMEAVPTKRPRVRHPERIALTPDAAERVDHWIGQLASRLSGKRLSRAELVNWVVLGRREHLEEAELTSLQTAHFDPVKALEWAVKQAKAARAKGQPVDLGDYFGAIAPPSSTSMDTGL